MTSITVMIDIRQTPPNQPEKFSPLGLGLWFKLKLQDLFNSKNLAPFSFRLPREKSVNAEKKSC